MQSEKLTPPTKHCYKKKLSTHHFGRWPDIIWTLGPFQKSVSAQEEPLCSSRYRRGLGHFLLSFNEEIIMLTSVYNNLQGLLEQLVTKCSHSALNKSLLSRHPQEILHFPSSFHFPQTQSHLLAH